MAVNKNFVVKNGLEVNTDLILADATNKKVGIASTAPTVELDVRGGIAATDLNITGVATIATLNASGGDLDVTTVDTSSLNVSGISTFTGIGTFASDVHVSGAATVSGDMTVGGDLNVTGDITYDEVTGRNLNITGVATFADSVYVSSGIGTIKFGAGIITALNDAGGTAGIITYYGDGSKLLHVSAGVGIGTTLGIVGYGVTQLDFKGPGFTTVFYSATTGIATMFFEGGGGGASVSVGTEAPSTPTSGDLWFNNDLGKTFIWYDEPTLGIGTQEVWIDAAPFNVGIISATSVELDAGTAAAPPLKFAGDPDTGLFQPAVNQQTFVAAGASILQINVAGVNITGACTATSFVGDGSGLTGVASTDNIQTATDATFLANVSIGGSLTVDGTFTRINTQVLDIEDKTVGVASTSAKTSATQNGAGLVMYGQTDVNFTYDVDKAAVGLSTGLSVSGFVTATSAKLDSATIGTINYLGPEGVNVSGAVTATSFSGDGSALTGVISGIDVQASGSLTGTASTALNFTGATITADNTVGIATITISSGISTEAATPTNAYTYLDLDGAQGHRITAAGITTISATGGTEQDSHTVIITNSGITTIGFTTYFLWPSGSAPTLPTTDGAVSLISFTVNQVGTAGTQLLAGASVNYS